MPVLQLEIQAEMKKSCQGKKLNLLVLKFIKKVKSKFCHMEFKLPLFNYNFLFILSLFSFPSFTYFHFCNIPLPSVLYTLTRGHATVLNQKYISSSLSSVMS